MRLLDARPVIAPIILVACLFGWAAPEAFAQAGSGSIAGRVTDAVSGAPLAGADVILDGTAHIAATDQTGAFRLAGVPAGKYSLLVTYLGHADQRADVSVEPGRILPVEVKLPPSGYSETVEVKPESINEGQASALNQQRTAPSIVNVVAADQIGSFPDSNAAEAAARIPGVSIARDQGEGRYILIRGTEPRLNSVMIDGERIPAPEGDTRQVQLDAVPADQLQAIEVFKALTPDMDADAIGGSVNLVTRQAVSKPTMLFQAAGGYNALQGDAGQRQFSGTVGGRFADGKFGVLLGGSASNLNRGSEDFEAAYSNGSLSDFQLRDYQIARDRYGFNTTVDVRASDNASFIFRTILNDFNDYERNNRVRFRPSNSRIERVMKNRNQGDTIRSVSGSGQHVLGTGTTIDYKLSWARSAEDQPDRLDTTFRQSKVTFAPNVSSDSIDPNNIQPNPSSNDPLASTLNVQSLQVFDTVDRDIVGQFNARMPIGGGVSSTNFVKFGAKVRDKHKTRDTNNTDASPVGTVPFAQLQDTGFKYSNFMSFFPANPPYAPQLAAGINADVAREYYNNLPASNKEYDPESAAESYDAKERVVAAYAMAEIYLGPKLLLLPGVRYESTRVDYQGYQILYDDGGDYVSTSPVTGGDTYGVLLPGVHVRYSPDESTNLRLAYARTLARPNYYDLVPYQIVQQENATIDRGNSGLKPSVADNLDVMLERYFRSVGSVSGGFFYKHVNDYIYPFRFTEQAYGDTYYVTQPRNGDSAALWGLEVAFQNQFRFLPAPFDGLGLYANYTWTNSSATLPDRTTTSTLPGQSADVGNLAVWYEKAGFSVRASWNFHGRYVDSVGADAATDVYYDNHKQLDFSVSQRITRNIQLYADFLNLTNAPLRYYEGAWDRPIQQEYYRWWTMAGVRLHF